MVKTEFKAESKRLLDLMINSIYTHKEIFLREIISNASDATDKRYYNAMQKGETGLNRSELSIDINIDKENRTITVTDHGCGMTEEELNTNLGTIAKSGSLDFKTNQEKSDDIDIIGQFGVGFYSAFMVSKNVKVITRSESAEQGYVWESDGADGYTITPCDKDTIGTEIVMTIKDNTPEENYDEFLDTYHIHSIIKKYSDYIHYPINLPMESTHIKEDSDPENPEYETVMEVQRVNSMTPLWKKMPAQITEDEYTRFYREKYLDFEDPILTIHTNTEGSATYTAMMFVPQRAPYDFYTKDYKKGLALYASGVLIMDKCEDLLPDHFAFVRGLVDSQDLSLNISREMLQHDRQLKLISTSLEKKIKSELLKLLKNDREKYEKMYESFGLQLKAGCHNDYGAHKEMLQDLLLFYSSTEKKMVTLNEYTERMKEDQTSIYYACGRTVEQIDLLPQMELFQEKGYEVLYLTHEIDEFAIKMMRDYKEKPFKSIADGDIDLESAEEKEEAAKKAEDNKDLLDFCVKALDGKVKEVKLSTRLKSHPVCLSTDGPLSLEMERVLQAMPNSNVPKMDRILEINANHPIFQTLSDLHNTDEEKASSLASILYNQALLIEGLNIEDPVAYANAVCSMLSK
ncbi:MAG: molecular chaperone HtpG [Peptococcaceae bacterium]|nr:molecular chaperone HtpG [Peptococcaceae bacterium]